MRQRATWGYVLLVLLALAASANAQTVINPNTVEFDPSADHARTFEGVNLVESYRLDIYLVGATAPLTTASLGKPTPATDGKIRITGVAALAAIPVATKLEARVVAVGSSGEGVSTPSNPFGRLTAPAAATALSIKR